MNPVKVSSADTAAAPLISGPVRGHPAAVFPREAGPVPGSTRWSSAGGRALVLCNHLAPAVPAPLLPPHKSLAGPAAPSGESRAIWGGTEASSGCVTMTTGGEGKRSPWLQLCSYVGTRGREVQCVWVSGTPSAETLSRRSCCSLQEQPRWGKCLACTCVCQARDGVLLRLWGKVDWSVLFLSEWF